jgi:ASC-1-like (ASCH) protein
MEHIAIMNPKMALLNDIIAGKKKIESRWYKSKRAPWGRIKAEEKVYFKNSGKPITMSAEVQRVEQHELSEEVIRKIIKKHGGEGGINLSKKDPNNDFYKTKKYCILVFLKNPMVVKPFSIDKSGFGNANAWLCIENINKIRI